ncbi:hetI [Scenedesmus sp. PABB004]|nr:hetI [Scenedesmus sp. PABB004]
MAHLACGGRTGAATRLQRTATRLAPLLRSSRCHCISSAGSQAAATGQQQQQRAAPALARGEVHVWWLRSDQLSAAQVERCGALLSPADAAHVAGAAAEPDVAAERLLARALLRAVLASYLPGATPQQLEFGRGAHGKPHLLLPAQQLGGAAAQAGLAGSGLQFNLAHTRSLLGCAVCLGEPVGLDVELVRRAAASRPGVLRLARRRFSAEEAALLEGVAGDEARRALFMSLWTLKEAVVKAKGSGINAPPGLRGFSIRLGVDPARLERLLAAADAPGQPRRGGGEAAGPPLGGPHAGDGGAQAELQQELQPRVLAASPDWHGGGPGRLALRSLDAAPLLESWLTG